MKAKHQLRACPPGQLETTAAVPLLGEGLHPTWQSLTRRNCRLLVFVLSLSLSLLCSLLVYLSVRASVRPSVSLSVRPSVRPSVRLSVCPSIRPSVRPSFRLSVCLTFHATSGVQGMLAHLGVVVTTPKSQAKQPCEAHQRLDSQRFIYSCPRLCARDWRNDSNACSACMPRADEPCIRNSAVRRAREAS